MNNAIMKTILFILLTSLTFGQSGKSVLSQAQKDSVGAMISDSLNANILNSVPINNYIGALDTSLGWSFVIQAAVDANLGTGKNILFEGGKTYGLQIQKTHPYIANRKTCIDLKTGGIGLSIPKSCTIQLKDNQQTDATGAVDLIVWRNTSNIYIGGGGSITGNTTNQTGWTTIGVEGSIYSQLLSGNLICGFGTVRHSNSNITIDNLKLYDAFSEPLSINYCDGVYVKNISIWGVGEGLDISVCDNVFIENYTFNDSTDVTVGDLFQFELVYDFSVKGLHISNSNSGGAAIEMYGSQRGIISDFYVRNVAVGVSLGSPNGYNCQDILFTNGVMDSVTNWAAAISTGDNVIFSNIDFIDSRAGFYELASYTAVVKNCYFYHSNLFITRSPQVDVFNNLFRKSYLEVSGNDSDEIPFVNISFNTFDSSYVNFNNQGYASWYCEGNFVKNTFINQGAISDMFYGVTDSLYLDDTY